MAKIEIGRLLSTSTTQFVVGCKVSQLDSPGFGSLVYVPLENDFQIYGIIYDVGIIDDDLVRQLVTTDHVDEAIIADNRVNRNVPVEMSVLVVGYKDKGTIRHMLPPRPALSLDMIYLCDNNELAEFTGSGRFGYFRHLLRAKDTPIGELLAAHITQVYEANHDPAWVQRASRELITLLRDDHDTLMAVLGALSDAVPELPA